MATKDPATGRFVKAGDTPASTEAAADPQAQPVDVGVPTVGDVVDFTVVDVVTGRDRAGRGVVTGRRGDVLEVTPLQSYAVDVPATQFGA